MQKSPSKEARRWRYTGTGEIAREFSNIWSVLHYNDNYTHISNQQLFLRTVILVLILVVLGYRYH